MQPMQDAGVERLQFLHVEAGRRTTETLEIGGVEQLFRCSHGFDRIARADPRQQGDQRQRLHSHLTKSVAAERTQRSEEHTSELQSLMRISYAVFCLKKKNNIPQ